MLFCCLFFSNSIADNSSVMTLQQRPISLCFWKYPIQILYAGQNVQGCASTNISYHENTYKKCLREE